MSAWILEEADGVATLGFDTPGRSSNVLSQANVRELDQVLAHLATRHLAGLIIYSTKPQSFVVGADVYEFQGIRDSARAAELARTGQRVLERLAELPFPTVAAISGPCLGGGLELALACGYRIVADHARTRLGLPEIKLGIHPGFSGTRRLAATVGPFAALPLILKGKLLSAREARRIRLVDEIVAERHLMTAARAAIARPRPRRTPWWWVLTDQAPARRLAAFVAERKLAKEVPARHYPAPYHVLRLWRERADDEGEARSLGELIVTPTSRALVRTFLLREDMRRVARQTAHGIRNVHVVGAGVMGAEIALWCAVQGFRVSVEDRHPEAIGRLFKLLGRHLERHHVRGRAAEEVADRLIPDPRGRMAPRADLVIEAIIEDVAAKQGLFERLERDVPPETLIASNTSSLPMETLAQGLGHPERFFGLHFFNPVSRMPLVEVVRGAATSAETAARGASFASALDRVPLAVASRPGFLVNRVLMPYLMEAVTLYEEGVRPEAIDAAAKAFGMPMGPIALADMVGIDICLSVASHLAPSTGLAVPQTLAGLIGEGRLGRKSGRGFYRYGADGSLAELPRDAGAPADDTTDRLIWRLVNEAARCLRERVAEDADAIDLGLTFGAGFAPFRGGPLAYAEGLGSGAAHLALSRLCDRFGDRFRPDDVWLHPDLFARRALVAGA